MKTKTKIFLYAIAVVALVLLGNLAINFYARDGYPKKISAFVEEEKIFKFNGYGILEEAGSIDESLSSKWWLNSGGCFYRENGAGRTMQGEIPDDSKWRLAYLESNPIDTDGGYHPQNIFRLITRDKWQNFRQEGYFKINKYNLSDSPNRNESNGILLFSRYLDSDNLYYAGVRVDGTAIIKKKLAGKYYTLVQKQLTEGVKYDKESNPNLLPSGEWIGIRSEISNTPEGDVRIILYVDIGKTGVWKIAAEAIDKENGNESGLITDEGRAGIRTDFMDVEFDDYRLRNINFN